MKTAFGFPRAVLLLDMGLLSESGFIGKVLATPPSPPASGYTELYRNSDGNWYERSPAGVDTLFPNIDLSAYVPYTGATGDISANSHYITDLLDPVNGQDAATKQYVDIAVQSINIEYFLLDTASGVSTYKNASTTEVTTGTPSVSKLNAPSGNTFIYGWITPTGEPVARKLIPGIYEAHIHATKDAGARDLRLFFTLVERKTDNSEVTIATSEDSDLFVHSDGVVEISVHASITNDYNLSVGSRLVFKWWAKVAGAGGNVDLTLYYQGITSSHFAFPTNISVLDNVYVKLDQSSPQTLTGFTDGFLQLTSGVLGTGTVDLSGYVPYTGASADVDLGTFDLTTTGTGTFGLLFVDTDNGHAIQLGTTVGAEDHYITSDTAFDSIREMRFGSNASQASAYPYYRFCDDDSSGYAAQLLIGDSCTTSMGGTINVWSSKTSYALSTRGANYFTDGTRTIEFFNPGFPDQFFVTDTTGSLSFMNAYCIQAYYGGGLNGKTALANFNEGGRDVTIGNGIQALAVVGNIIQPTGYTTLGTNSDMGYQLGVTGSSYFTNGSMVVDIFGTGGSAFSWDVPSFWGGNLGGSAGALYASNTTGQYVYLADYLGYAVNATGGIAATNGTTTSGINIFGYGVYGLAGGQTAAAYFDDGGTTSVTISNGTYAISLTGNSAFNGDLEVSNYGGSSYGAVRVSGINSTPATDDDGIQFYPQGRIRSNDGSTGAFVSIDPYSRYLNASDGTSIFADWSGTANGSAAISWDSASTRLLLAYATDDGTNSVQIGGSLRVNDSISIPLANMPTADPADGNGTLWYDTITRIVYMGT
jgi:hypothetical protein